MKKGMLTLALAGLLAGFSYGADNTASLSTTKLVKAVEDYTLALKSENPGVRSSALYMLALIKSQYPKLNVSEVKSKLSKLSRKDDDPVVRIHANLILSYLNSDSLMTKIKVEDPRTPAVFYSQLIAEMTASPDEAK